MLRAIPKVKYQAGQKESGRRLFMAMGVAAACVPSGAGAQTELDAGGLTFKDFGTNDNGASFYRADPSLDPTLVANAQLAKVLAIDKEAGLARVLFQQVRIEISLPLGWQANEDWERGLAFSGDKRYRALVWRVDFAFEGVRDAEHYAATKSGSIKARRPGIQAQARKLGNGTFLVAYENVPAGRGDSEKRAVFDIVMGKPDDPKTGALLTMGVPASDAARGLSLLALLKQSLKIEW
jgi:hypothetical protein